MNLYLHCGETLDHDNDNLELILTHVKDIKRIGHGTQLIFKPHLLKEIKERDIAIEVCPLSNQLLNYTKNLQLNQGNLLNRSDIPFTISSDDPTMFQSSQVEDFFYGILSWGMTLDQVHQCLINNIHYGSDLSSQ